MCRLGGAEGALTSAIETLELALLRGHAAHSRARLASRKISNAFLAELGKFETRGSFVTASLRTAYAIEGSSARPRQSADRGAAGRAETAGELVDDAAIRLCRDRKPVIEKRWWNCRAMRTAISVVFEEQEGLALAAAF